MSQEFEVAAQRLASELNTNPQAAAGELQQELFRAEQSRRPEAVRGVEALANRADELAGPCANHLQITQDYRGPEVRIIPSNCGGQNYYAPQYPGQYNQYPGQPQYNPYGGGQYYNQAPPPPYGGQQYYRPQYQYPPQGGVGVGIPLPGGGSLMFRLR